MEAQLVTLVICVALLLLNVVLVLEVRDLKRARRRDAGWPAEDPQDVEPPPERNPHVIKRERDRIRADLRARFPNLSDGELARATEEILTKARETLARIP